MRHTIKVNFNAKMLKSKRVHTATVRLIAALIIAVMIAPLSPPIAQAIGEQVLRLASPSGHSKLNATSVVSQDIETASERETRIAHIRLCPRKLRLYEGESTVLVPMPIDRDKEAVNGVSMEWETRDPGVAQVTNYGEVSAINVGHTIVTARSGKAHAKVAVEVRAGVRPILRNMEWEREHQNDCDEQESSQLDNPQQNVAEAQSTQERAIDGFQPSDDLEEGSLPDATPASLQGAQRARSAQSLKALVKPASLHVPAGSVWRAATAATGKKVFGRGLYSLSDPIDGDSDDWAAPKATSFSNAIGSPRFSPQEETGTGATRTRKNLGSYNYQFAAPVFGLGGRGIGVNLALTYNSRLWNRDGTTMSFNYNKGWPAAGWSLGYGRIIKNYDNTASGSDPGNFLLIQPDGTRIHFERHFVNGAWSHDSTDGTFLHLSSNKNLKYPDGTAIKYSDAQTGRLVPVSITTRNGSMITIAYKQPTSTFKYRWAIDYIRDTLGRYINFHYYGDTGYPVDTTNPQKTPASALAAVSAPDQAGGAARRVLVRLEYQNITLTYDFGGMTVIGPASNSTLTVIKRIYYPQSGRGYLFEDYSTYGMARRVSVRKDMTGAGAIVDGAEIAYTKYYYTTIGSDPIYNRSQVGSLNDSPQYTEQHEWWQDKTDDSGNPDTNPTKYRFERTAGTDDLGYITEADKVIHVLQNGQNGLEVWTITSNDPLLLGLEGKVITKEYRSGSTVLQKIKYSYTNDLSGGSQIGSVETFDENNQPTKVGYSYAYYGRVVNVREYGYKINGNYQVRRRTEYSYKDDTVYLDQYMYRLVKEVKVFDSGLDTNDANDTLLAHTENVYDDYGVTGGMETYNLTTYPDTHDAAYNQTKTNRGNVTGTKNRVTITPETTLPQRNIKYDVFGNVVEADVTCCMKKKYQFSATHWYSQPDWVRDGGSSGPYLTTSYEYNFETGLMKKVTNPEGTYTTFAYDSAWRLSTVTAPTGAVTTTSFDRVSGNDQLSYTEQVSYNDVGNVPKTITNKSWFDGAGRALRSGTATSSAPSSYDTVAVVYDSLGRVLKQSNPYIGDSAGNVGTGVTLYWAKNTYDMLSRVTRVTLPDSQFVSTSYAGATGTSGATVTVTDQVGRKRRSEVDGLGRIAKVTEQDPVTGSLSLETTCTYNALDNLTGVNQGNQIRSFSYDALSRLTTQTTPEAGTVSYFYWDSGQIKKRVDARNVETHYKYDSLNRLTNVWYTGLEGNDDGSVRPALPTEVAATNDVLISYNTSTPGNGQVYQMTDQAGTETFNYDEFGRLKDKTRSFLGANSYTTKYEYNALNQQTLIEYPSGKRVRASYDQRGRFSSLDKVNSTGGVVASYVTSVGYNTAGLVTNLNLGSGVVGVRLKVGLVAQKGRDEVKASYQDS